MRKTLSILGPILAVLLAGFVYYKNVTVPKAPKIEYEKTFHIAYTIRRDGVNVALGPCNEVTSTFKVQGDTAYLQFEDKPVIKYRVDGIDSDNGLHISYADTVKVSVYKVYDPRYKNNMDSAGLQMRFKFGEIIIFPSKKCF